MAKNLLLIVLAISISIQLSETSHKQTKYTMRVRSTTFPSHHRHLGKQSMRESHVRCSRRFSPGSCLGYKIPVWTYVPQLQNCTQRLGCLSAKRSNRFASYDDCITGCISLIDLYTYMLTIFENGMRGEQLRQAAGHERGTLFGTVGRRRNSPHDELSSNHDILADMDASVKSDSSNFDVDILRQGLVDGKTYGQVDYDRSLSQNEFESPELESLLKLMPDDVDRETV